jgi:tripartite-type tricarboxylate transporter receptor subunit TctC
MVEMRALHVLCTILLLAGAPPLAAQTYPSKTIRMVVPFPGGGATDATARLFGQLLSVQLGQSIVVENKPGATGSIGAIEAAKATPDGHTILYTSSSFALAPLLYSKLRYDPIQDFTPIALTVTQPVLVVVNPQLPAKNLAELIAHAKANPAAISYGSSGSGGINHLASSEFAGRFGVQMTHVPYKGGAPAMVDVISGQIQMMFAPVGELLPYLQGNRVRALAVIWPKRSVLLPDVPTITEATKQNYTEIGVWHGVLVPKGTPKDIVARLQTEVNKAVQNPELRAKLVAQGNVMLGGSSDEFVAHLKGEMSRWGKVVKDLDLKPFD